MDIPTVQNLRFAGDFEVDFAHGLGHGGSAARESTTTLHDPVLDLQDTTGYEKQAFLRIEDANR